MKKVLLISNYVFHYRARIYNHFYEEFKKLGYEFHVLSNEFQDCNIECRFVKHVEPFSIIGYIKKVKSINPDVAINFLHLKDGLIFPLTIYCRFKSIPMIYWNHGVNLSKAGNRWLNAIYKVIHKISSAIILYTPNELKYVSSKAHKKTFIAFNTLCFDDVDKRTILDKDLVKKKYSINETKTILFISRIMPYKKLGVLLKSFLSDRDIALVIVGDGINQEQLKIIDEVPHYYYFGAKYGQEVDELFNVGDVYSTPGHIGLGLIQAFFWGKPVVVLNVRHAPEIYYLKNGKNGYLAENEKDLKEKIMYLLRDDKVYREFSRNALETIDNAANIEKMFDGFRDAVSYCIDR